MKIRLSKAKSINPSDQKMGYVARVQSNGTATFEDLCKEAGHNTSMHRAEIEACAKLFCEAAAEQVKKGMIVDFGPLGKLYPSCNSGWVESEDKLSLSTIRAHVNYRPSDDIKAAIQGASLSWTKVAEDSESTVAPEGDKSETEQPEAEKPTPDSGGYA